MTVEHDLSSSLGGCITLIFFLTSMCVNSWWLHARVL